MAKTTRVLGAEKLVQGAEDKSNSKEDKSFFQRFFKSKADTKTKSPSGRSTRSESGLQPAEILRFSQRADFYIDSADMRLMQLLAVLEEELQELHTDLKAKKEEFRELDSNLNYSKVRAVKLGDAFVVTPTDEIESYMKKYKTDLRAEIKVLSDNISRLKENIVQIKTSMSEKFSNASNRTPVAIFED